MKLGCGASDCPAQELCDERKDHAETSTELVAVHARLAETEGVLLRVARLESTPEGMRDYILAFVTPASGQQRAPVPEQALRERIAELEKHNRQLHDIAEMRSNQLNAARGAR